MWSDVPKEIQITKIDILHIDRLRQKQSITGRFSGGTKRFLPAADFNVMNCKCL